MRKLAKALGVAHTHGFNWIEHIIQVVVAAIGVALVAGTGRSRVSSSTDTTNVARSTA